jgi:hypothetical protein
MVAMSRILQLVLTIPSGIAVRWGYDTVYLMHNSVCPAACEVEDLPDLDVFSSKGPENIPLKLHCQEGVNLEPSAEWELDVVMRPDIILDIKCGQCDEAALMVKTVDKDWQIDLRNPIIGKFGTIQWQPPRIPEGGVPLGNPIAIGVSIEVILLNYFFRTPLVNAGVPFHLTVSVVQEGKTMICLKLTGHIRWKGYELKGSPCEAACELDEAPNFFLEGWKQEQVSVIARCKNDVLTPAATWKMDTSVDPFRLTTKSPDGGSHPFKAAREASVDVSLPVLGKVINLNLPPAQCSHTDESARCTSLTATPLIKGNSLLGIYRPFIRRILKRTPVQAELKLIQKNQTIACMKSEIKLK